MKKYILSTHVSYTQKGYETYGPAHSVEEFLHKHDKRVITIKHALHGKIKSKYVVKKKEVSVGRLQNTHLLVRSLEHVILNISITLNQKESKLIYIGADPINALSGVILRMMNRVHKIIYFSVDYTENRFDNLLLNKIYHFLDLFVARKSDEVWCVSSRILRKRIDQGINRDQLIFVPNTPYYKSVPRKKYNGNLNLVIVSHLSKSLNLNPVLDAVKKLTKEYKDLKLLIIGTGPEENSLKKFVKKKKIDNFVAFLGQLNHHEALEQISNSFLGFALYTNENSWNVYGDSMKAREYVAAGIPVIINDIPSTADDIRMYNAGVVLEKVNSATVSDFIIRCINDNKYYMSLRQNSKKLGLKYDKEAILSNILV